MTFRIDGEVTISKLADAFSRFEKILDHLDDDEDVRIRWVLADLSYSSAVITARAVALDEPSEAFVPRVISSFTSAAREALDPTANDRPLLRAVRDLAQIADEANPVVLETEADDVVFTSPIGPGSNRDEAASTTQSLGTVRGRVETLSHRGRLRFVIYELLNDKAVSCYLAPHHESIMRDAWGQVADVTGVVTRNAATGQPITVRQVTQVDLVPEGNPLDYRRARGLFYAAEPAEAIIRRIRDAS